MKKSGTSVALVITILNEEQSLPALLKSISNQTLLPSEVIVVDGGSTDASVQIAKDFFAQSTVSAQIFSHKSNRSEGRNYGVNKTSARWIGFTDAGCVLEKNWLENLVDKQKQTKARVVAGYYRGETHTALQEAMVPYFLVMPERAHEGEFLPATRSMLIEKKLYLEMGGLTTNLEVSEDYDLALRLQAQGEKIAFAKNAVVIWSGPTTMRQFAKLIFSFAVGDKKAGIQRKKVHLIYLRYLIGGFGILLVGIYSFALALLLALTALLFYSAWSIKKNAKYAPRGWFYLPLLQILSDLAIISAILRQ